MHVYYDSPKIHFLKYFIPVQFFTEWLAPPRPEFEKPHTTVYLLIKRQSSFWVSINYRNNSFTPLPARRFIKSQMTFNSQ